ncbi:UDP-N-acetylmuramoyl-tripeptide--D-alanyl-D-alanine ligase [Anaerotardibacter muris]|uniref:UDP-N-acetylmuramoyl-tripeptide--D-alanyl-D- alanine ligase n=1 Tax=Anaerotardibacter muris TaxID=2941505 RepID=UPI00203A77CA|nr:UDP-N-acetylmuramoyl-tripeptide--D-alanyl-D-alanine ligase [Anaerotardibacter muris]
MRLNSKQIAEFTGATVIVEALDPSHLALGLTWDSRDVHEDDVYVALPGERVDGHTFIDEALRKGAHVILCMQRVTENTQILAQEMGAAILEVSSTFAAITDLARAWRGFIKGTVIALTGSTGKTTTKNLVRDVLSTTYNVVATHANQNNELGVPKTLLDADPETDFVVVEMGMRGTGQLAKLCSFVRPDMTLVTNIGEAHIELLGSREAIARAKAEVVEALPNGTGVAVLNYADDHTLLVCEAAQTAKRGIQVLFFDGTGSYDPLANEGVPCVWASDIVLDEKGCPHFDLHIPDLADPLDCEVGLQGLHNVHNACAAATLAHRCGVSLEAIARGLRDAVPEVGRQEMLAGKGDVTVINDAYNANPDSMRASLAMFSALKVKHKRYAVLGDMGELGSFAQACHEGVGRYAATQDIDVLVCVGDLAHYIAEGAREAGFPADRIISVATRGEALNELETRLEAGDAVLVKASHSMELDRIVRGLQA